MTTSPRILIYLLRRDLRLTDNLVFHEISKAYSSSTAHFTHLLPIYVFPAQQIEVSGFLPASNGKQSVSSPYPPARTPLAGFWRCGPHRAKFVTESIWDLRSSLQELGSSVIIRAGLLQDVVRDAIDWLEGSGQKNGQVANGEPSRGEIVGVWMTQDEPVEEQQEEKAVKKVLEERGKEFRLFNDQKYFVDEYVLPPILQLLGSRSAVVAALGSPC